MSGLAITTPAPVAKTSAALAVALENEMARLAQEPGWRSAPTRHAEHVIEEARALLQRTADILRPATPEHIARWVGPLNSACRNPQSPEEIEGWAEAVAFACQRIPASVFGPDSLRRLMAVTAFFPSAADILAIVQPEADRIHRKIAATRAIASPPEQSAPPKRADEPVDVARILGMAAQRMQEARENDDKLRRQGRAEVKALPVSDGALLATYEKLAQQGNQAAAHRARMLQERFAKQGIAV